MTEFNNDTFSVLNYQGSKKNLLEFIYTNTKNYIDKDRAVLDMFSGTSSVAYSLKRYHKVYANDSELYASIIASALLCFNNKKKWVFLQQDFIDKFNHNYNELKNIFNKYLIKEQEGIVKQDVTELEEVYQIFPVIWGTMEFDYWNGKIKTISDLRKYKSEIPYMLFTTYYSTTYFGIEQAIQIDSIRYAIEELVDYDMRNMLLTSLYFAMKECVFAKDGHMAQPLDRSSNTAKLLRIRSKNIYSIFMDKVLEFCSDEFFANNNQNKVFQMSMEELITQPEIKNSVGFIYADPPYTDMQYSRYYHLLNTVTLYDYTDISFYRGKLSKGLYREDRFQSPLSQRSQAPIQIQLLFDFCKSHHINLGVSFAYPRDPENQATNRYTMSIDYMVQLAKNTFGGNNIEIVSEEYEHSNNRNADTKKVLEYLVLCKG